MAFLKNRAAAVAAAVFCTLLWGTAFPFIKLGYAAFGIGGGDVGSRLLFAGLRFSLAGLILLAFLLLTKRRGALLPKSEFLPVLLMGMVQTFAQYMFTYIGLGLTTAANTSIITACASFLTVLAVPFFFKSDRLTAVKLLGCAVGFGGVLVMNKGGGVSAATIGGDALILLSTVCAAGGNIIAKKFADGRDPVRITAWQLLLGGLTLSAAGLILGGRLDLREPRGIAILLWLAFVSAAATAVWTALLKYHPASRISVFVLLVPVFGTALSGLLLGEDVFRAETLISLVMIAVGIVLVNISKSGKVMEHD